MSATRRETREERDERYKRLLFTGAPMPNGWEMPHRLLPPQASVPQDVGRVKEELDELTKATFGSWDRVPSDVGVMAAPGRDGTWNDLSEGGKLHVIDNWVDWTGVQLEDRATLTIGQLDLSRLDRYTADALLQAAGRETLSQAEEAERQRRVEEEMEAQAGENRGSENVLVLTVDPTSDLALHLQMDDYLEMLEAQDYADHLKHEAENALGWDSLAADDDFDRMLDRHACRPSPQSQDKDVER